MDINLILDAFKNELEAKELLNCKTIDEKRALIETFGGHVETKLCNRVRICVNTADNMKVYMMCFVSDICHLLKKSDNYLAVQNHLLYRWLIKILRISQ